MKKVIPLLLITLIFLNTFGFNLILDSLLYKCKSDFSRERLFDSRKIVVLKILPGGKKNLQRIDDNEIRYNDKMYDVIREDQNNSALYIYCINDKKEDRLFEILFKINKSDPKEQSDPFFTKNNLIKNYILNENNPFCFQYVKKGIISRPAIKYNAPLIEIVLPPPESPS